MGSKPCAQPDLREKPRRLVTLDVPERLLHQTSYFRFGSGV